MTDITTQAVERLAQRHTLNDDEAATLRALAAERDAAIAEAHATGHERASWKDRAEKAEAQLAGARDAALVEVKAAVGLVRVPVGSTAPIWDAMDAIEALRDKPAPGVTVREANWQWWAGDNDEWFTVGPCDTKEEAIQQAIEDEVGLWFDKSQDPPCLMQAFHVVEARQDQLKLSDWVDAEQIIERADEALADSDRVSCENGDGPWFEATPDQDVDLTRRIKLACDEWQTAHGLVFHSNTFSHQRNSETIKPAIAGGGDE